MVLLHGLALVHEGKPPPDVTHVRLLDTTVSTMRSFDLANMLLRLQFCSSSTLWSVLFA